MFAPAIAIGFAPFPLPIVRVNNDAMFGTELKSLTDVPAITFAIACDFGRSRVCGECQQASRCDCSCEDAFHCLSSLSTNVFSKHNRQRRVLMLDHDREQPASFGVGKGSGAGDDGSNIQVAIGKRFGACNSLQ
jgi:hypothetical protein